MGGTLGQLEKNTLLSLYKSYPLGERKDSLTPNGLVITGDLCFKDPIPLPSCSGLLVGICKKRWLKGQVTCTQVPNLTPFHSLSALCWPMAGSRRTTVACLVLTSLKHKKS